MTRSSSLASSDSNAPGGVILASAADAIDVLRPRMGSRLLLATDFDGTLSRLVLDPWRAGIIPGAQRALRRLSVAPGTHLAFISGRTVPDLAARARVGNAAYHGDHGAQWAWAQRGFRPASLQVEREPVDPVVLAMADRLKAEVPRQVDETWLVVEDKGPAVTFHFRGAPDVEGARTRIRAAVAAIDRDRVLDQLGGRRAWELRPPNATTKAMALARLIEQHRPDTVLMLGDDRHDARAFAEIGLARERDGLAGLAVGVLSRASDPQDLARRADVVFAGADVSARFLALLARERGRHR